MAASDELRDAVNELEATLRRSAELTDDRVNDNRLENVQLRRLVAGKVAEIGVLGEAVFSTGKSQAEFRREFSALRAAHASHQASFPLSSTDFADPAFVAAVRRVREANSKFISWVRAVAPR